MKKQYLIAVLFTVCCSVLIFSCNKYSSINQESNGPAAVFSSGALSAGEVHNNLLSEYKANKGKLGTEYDRLLTISETRETFKEILAISDKETNYYTASDQEELTALFMEQLESLDCFTTTGNLKDEAELSLISINDLNSTITNIDIKNVYQDIHNYNGSDFITYAKARISTLANLTTNEQQQVNGYLSVLEHSYSFWQSQVYGSG